MKWNVFFLAAVFACAAPHVFAQGHGGQGGPPKGQGQGQAQKGQSGQKGRGQADRDRDRLRIHATDQQRDQYRMCDQSMDRVRTRAREMSKMGGGKGYDAVQARKNRDQVREQLNAMEQEHHRFMEGLDAEQKKGVEARHHNMEQIHERINNHMQQMDQELAKTNPDGKLVAEQARFIEREMKEIQKQHREMGQDLGLKP